MVAGIIVFVLLLVREKRLPGQLARLRRRQECFFCGHDLTAITHHRCPECGKPVAPYSCGSCGHSLAGLTSERCPECGAEIPASLRTLVRSMPE
jgi:predicted RNA-binding Zn-ribbon protein involved in translation (DUF1610 family)